MTERPELTPELRDAIAATRKEFNSAAAALRPRLHRFCTRMCGSPLDAEDVVQETLAEAFYNLSTLKEATRFEPWLFRIAYHKSIDFRRRDKRRTGEVILDEARDTPVETSSEADVPTDDALVALVGELPPKERAVVILNDVLELSLADVAVIAGTTTGGVKAALHRARGKLRAMKQAPEVAQLDPERRKLFEAYAECFNQRDWEGLRELVRADARLEIVGERVGVMSGLGATYSGNYTQLPWQWRLSASEIGGEHVILHWRKNDSEWVLHAAVRLSWTDARVSEIRDYIHIPYLMQDTVISA